MKKSILTFDKCAETAYHAVFRNNHSRKIYIKIMRENDMVDIVECFYVDRPWSGNPAVPKRLTTERCTLDELYDVIADELDKKFYSIEFSDTVCNLSEEDYIASRLSADNKYKFLIFVQRGDVLCTRLKNRVHRTIYLELRKDDGKGLVQECHYCDRRYRRTNKLIIPAGLHTIFFDFSYDNILKIVNNELNCDFSHVIITDDTFDFDNSSIPVCGSI